MTDLNFVPHLTANSATCTSSKEFSQAFSFAKRYDLTTLYKTTKGNDAAHRLLRKAINVNTHDCILYKCNDSIADE